MGQRVRSFGEVRRRMWGEIKTSLPPQGGPQCQITSRGLESDTGLPPNVAQELSPMHLKREVQGDLGRPVTNTMGALFILRSFFLLWSWHFLSSPALTVHPEVSSGVPGLRSQHLICGSKSCSVQSASNPSSWFTGTAPHWPHFLDISLRRRLEERVGLWPNKPKAELSM